MADASGRLFTSCGSLEVGKVIDEEDQRRVGPTHQTCQVVKQGRTIRTRSSCLGFFELKRVALELKW